MTAIKNCFLLTTVLFCSSLALAQNADNQGTDSAKRFDHMIGLQVNGMIRQVFNFNNTTQNTNTNPYLLTYTISNRKGWGIRVGLGYNYSSTTADDGINKNTSTVNDMQIRLGVEKQFKLVGKWTAGVGIDGLMNTNNDNTVSSTISFDTVTVTTKTTISSYGAGVMGWLHYNFTKNILFGTEASFYYLTGKQKVTVSTKNSNLFANPTPASSTTSNNLATGTISLPIVFYLLIRF